MIHPSDPELRTDRRPRRPATAPVTCAACGCRLAAMPATACCPLQPARRARCPRLPRRVRRRRPRRRRPARSPSPSDRRPSRLRPRRIASGRPSSSTDPVADAADGDDLRPARGLDLGPQAGEVRLEPEQVRVGLGRPAGAREPEVRDDVAAGADERLEQAELGRRQVERDARRPAPRGGRLEDELARASAVRRRCRAGPPTGRRAA